MTYRRPLKQDYAVRAAPVTIPRVCLASLKSGSRRPLDCGKSRDLQYLGNI